MLYRTKVHSTDRNNSQLLVLASLDVLYRLTTTEEALHARSPPEPPLPVDSSGVCLVLKSIRVTATEAAMAALLGVPPSEAWQGSGSATSEDWDSRSGCGRWVLFRSPHE